MSNPMKDNQITTDPSKPAQRMRAGSLRMAALPWIIATLALLVMPYVFNDNSAITIMNQMAITIIFALAYNMLLGQGGMLSFGHAVYAGVGGFACMHVMASTDFFSMLPLPVLPIFGGLFGMGLAMIIGSFSTRSAGTVFAMISLGVGELIAACSVIIVAFFGGEEGISGDRTYGLPFFGIEFLHQIEVYYLIAFWLILSALLIYRNPDATNWPNSIRVSRCAPTLIHFSRRDRPTSLMSQFHRRIRPT